MTLSEAAAAAAALWRRVQQVQPRYLQHLDEGSGQAGRASPQGLQRAGSAWRELAEEAAVRSAGASPPKRGKSAASPLQAAQS